MRNVEWEPISVIVYYKDLDINDACAENLDISHQDLWGMYFLHFRKPQSAKQEGNLISIILADSSPPQKGLGLIQGGKAWGLGQLLPSQDIFVPAQPVWTMASAAPWYS